MSDITGGGGSAAVTNGRAQNGGARGPGPVPVSQQYRSTGVRTPTDIVRGRLEREARRKADSEARQRQLEEQRRLQEEGKTGPRRRSDPAGAEPEDLGGTRQRSGDPTRRSVEARDPDNRRSGGGRPSGEPKPVIDQASHYTRPERPAETPASIITAPASTARGRVASGFQQQPRPFPQDRREPPTTYSTQPQPSQSRQPSGAQTQPNNAATAGAQSQPQPAQESNGGAPQRGTTSSFPHAFERWETLSSHWEGLTSYWIRRLQNNSDEMNREPLNQQMARQVTDLSAAGANLFHAVVELQRLRASSERKFQRWFFDTRAEQERARELQGRLENDLRTERQLHSDAVAELARLRNAKDTSHQDRGATDQVLAEVRAKDTEVKETRRELQISKEEARRAWEELGRREQEERDRTISLRNGEPTLVGGVQVVPMVQGVPSRQESTNRPATREGPPGSAPTANSARSGPQSVGSPLNEPGTYYDQRSETDTDPYTENGRVPASQATHPTMQTSTAPQQQTSNGSSVAARAAQTTSTAPSAQATAGSSAPGGTYLRYGPTGPTAQPGASSFYQHEGSSLQPEGEAAAAGEPDDRSFVPSNEDTFSEEEYEYDQNGNIIRDRDGRPMIYRRGPSSEGTDEYDVQEAADRERMYGQRYGSGISGVEYGSGSTASAGPRLQPGARGAAQVVHGREETQPETVDYSGSAYGAGLGWESVPRHHHPTRLSDVLEEDERSRTSPSRASQASRSHR